MTDPMDDYRLANIQNREMKLRARRLDILRSEPEKALDMILEAPAPVTLIQSFPDQDLYYLMHKIGPYDFIPVLAMAASEQWEYILDMEVWDNDRLDTDMMTRAFDVLYQADPARLLRWVIMEKPDFFEFYLFKYMDIRIREHDEMPPDDHEDYLSLDDKFYIRFPDDPLILEDDEAPVPENREEARELIEKMLRKLAEMDLSVYHGLLLETRSTLTAETEEDQFRLKTQRLAEKGFLPTHEAIGIYQPTRVSAFRKRPATASKGFDPDLPLPPQYFTRTLDGDDLLKAAMNGLDPDFAMTLESELAALINKVISADKIRLRSREDLDKAAIKTRDYLNLGLEVLLRGRLSEEGARDMIKDYFLEDIFRTGSRAGIILKTKAVNWFRNSFMKRVRLPLRFLGETYLGVVGGLFLERPLYFADYAQGERYRHFRSIPDITRTDRLLDEIIALDRVLDALPVDIASFRQGVLTYKTLILTLWAGNRLGLPPDLKPMDPAVFIPFFKALFTEPDSKGRRRIQLEDLSLFLSEATGMDEKTMGKDFGKVTADLIQELEEEYGQIDPETIDPRFIPHFLLAVPGKK